ncbi:uncharacterized protein LOC126907198 [Daktulosphaira vitifoliae]|uniref:uncharacterized protein LOC126907198 n=1 Tax=Daktulosphaira vitifoliae TaxID=58002 RepID=UPI0021AAB5A4|nr:uncharacterized protein LOC126907198 [Daktulosphaira vitifoliae]
MDRIVKRLLSSCDLYQRAKPQTCRVEGLMKNIQYNAPNDCVFVDMYGPLPAVQLYPLNKATGVAIINRIIDNYIPDWGKPKIIISDHGKQFISKVWQSKLSMLGIPPTLTSVYHPQSNPTERVMRELGRLFRTYCSEYHAEWPRYVSYIEWVLNNTIHESTSFNPIEHFCPEKHQSLIQTIIDFPPGIDIPLETKFEIARQSQKNKAFARKQRHDRIGPHTNFNIGDIVLIFLDI